MPKTQRAASEIYRMFGSEVFEVIKNDARTNLTGNVYFGLTGAEISQLLENGRVDFSTGYKFSDGRSITSDELVICYCHFMMKGHLFAARANFQARQNWLGKILRAADRVVVIDFGCGPGTAGLAFAEIFPDVSFDYFGIDSAKAMRAKCDGMMAAAKLKGLLISNVAVASEKSWDDVPTTFGRKSAIILNFSYFFASKSLSDAAITSLVSFYNKLLKQTPDSRIVFSYSNSTHPLAAAKYKKFIKELELNYNSNPPIQSTVAYYTTMSGNTTKNTTFCHEMFEIGEVE